MINKKGNLIVENRFISVAVVGGDLRQWYLADILASKGHGVLAYGLCKDEKIEM